jgi:hypothetical protein
MLESKPPVDAVKVALIAEILKQGFPGDEIYPVYDSTRSAEFYRIGPTGALRHRVFVSKEFLDDHTAQEIPALFDSWQVLASIKTAGAHAVIVTNGGVMAGRPGGAQ